MLVNTDTPKNIADVVAALEQAAQKHADKHLKTFVVFINPDKATDAAMKSRLESIAADAHVELTALTYLPGPDDDAVSDYKINTDKAVKNTVFVYKNRTVDAKFVNFTADAAGVKALEAAIDHVLQPRPGLPGPD